MEDFRKKPLEYGIIKTNAFLKIIKSLHVAGFSGMTLTGGEPLLNPAWDKIVEKSKKIGMSRIGLTTNGVLLSAYLKKNKHLPRGLTLLTVSLDSLDPKRFQKITGLDKLKDIIKGLKAAKKDNPNLVIRANKVVLRSDLKSLLDYIKLCEKNKLVDEINLLNLILKNDGDKKFFENEFMSAKNVLEFFSNHAKYKFSIDKKYEYSAKLSSGLKIVLKDTNLTLRNNKCINCPIYCQEGFFTVRIATDGNITTCPDYHSQLPSIDGIKEIKKDTLDNKMHNLVYTLKKTKLKRTLDKFLNKHHVILPKNKN